MTCRPIEGRGYACDSLTESREANGARDWLDDTLLAVADDSVAIGKGTWNFVHGVLMFPDRFVGYVAGRDARMGEGRAWLGPWAYSPLKVLDSVERLGKGEATGYTLFDDPATRLVDAVEATFYGSLDALLGHIPNAAVNDGLGVGFPYFGPGPANLEEGTTEVLGGIALLSGVRAGIRGVMRRAGPDIPHESIAEGKLARELAAASKGFDDLPFIIRRLEWGDRWAPFVLKVFGRIPGYWKSVFGRVTEVAKGRDAAVVGVLCDLAEGMTATPRRMALEALAEMVAWGDDWALRRLCDLFSEHPDFWDPVFGKLTEYGQRNPGVLGRVAEFFSGDRSQMAIDAIVQLAGRNRVAAIAELGRLALVEDCGVAHSAIEALGRVARLDPFNVTETLAEASRGSHAGPAVYELRRLARGENDAVAHDVLQALIIDRRAPDGLMAGALFDLLENSSDPVVRQRILGFASRDRELLLDIGEYARPLPSVLDFIVEVMGTPSEALWQSLETAAADGRAAAAALGQLAREGGARGRIALGALARAADNGKVAKPVIIDLLREDFSRITYLVRSGGKAIQELQAFLN